MNKSYVFSAIKAMTARHFFTLILVLSGMVSLPALSQTCVQDQTIADFNLGTFGGNTSAALDGDGAVILRPGLDEEFSGSSLPSGWGQGSWPGSTLLPTFSGGQILVDGSHIYSTATFGPGSCLEFVATFTAGNFQNVGFSSNSNFDVPWVVIGRGLQGDNNLYARAYFASETNIILGELLGSPHTYKILWNSNNFEFYIDGATIPAAAIPHTLAAETRMVIQISDYYMTGTAVLSVDRMRVTPYVSSGSYSSRIYDGVSTKIWGEVIWTPDLPASTSLSIFARSGNTPSPDGTWTAFSELSSGSAIGMSSRYIQYRADLSTTDPLVTPALQDISISCTDGPLSPPAVTVPPVSQSRCEGSIASFTSVAVGVPAPTVQWEVSTDNGTNWGVIDGATNDTLSVVASMSGNGYLYRAVWSNLQLPDAISNAATLTVNTSDITGTIAAVNSTLCEGENIELQLSSATGLAPYSVIVNEVNYTATSVGAVFVTIPNVTATTTFYLTSLTDNNGCIVTGAISNVTVNVNPIPSGTITPVQTSVYEGENYELVFNATAATGPFELTINGTDVTSVTSGLSFPAGQASYTPRSIWPETVNVNIGGDYGSYELGRRFRSSVTGTITGIRFYKSGDQSLQFTVTLWDYVTHVILASKTSAYISDPGWTQVDFDTPIPISANTDYVASYFAPGGSYNYAFTSGNPFPIVNSPLTAYESYYNPDPGFPANMYAANYWVDVAFDDGGSSVSTLNLTSITSAAGCVSTGDPISSVSITVNRANVWNGAGIDSDWNTATNWSSGVVPVGVNVVIPVISNNNYPLISGSATTDALVITPSAELTVNIGGSLTAGSITINSLGTGSTGSLINYGTVNGQVTFNRYLRPEAAFGDRHFFSSPVSGQAIDVFRANNTFGEPAISKVAGLWGWNEAAINTWPEITLSTGSFTAGRGYNIDQVAGSDGLLSFAGTLNNESEITATAPYNSEDQHYDNIRGIWGGGGWNLLGNPFTSSMRVTDDEADGDDGNNENDFLARNLASFDPSYRAVYIYDGTEGDHGMYYYIAKPVPFTDPFIGEYPSNTVFASKYVQAGQGFYVLANYNGVTFSFARAMQAHNTGITMTKSARADDFWPGMHLKAKYGEKEAYTTIIFNEQMSTELDPGYDVGQLGSGQDVEIYTTLAAKDNGVNFTRQALPVAGCDRIIIPVGIDSEKGGEVIFSAYTVPIGSYKFWLEDRKTGIFTDLSTKSYTATLPASTYGTGRFFIIASINTPTGLERPAAEETDVRIWASNGKVIIQGEVSNGTMCEIYDVRGRMIVEIKLTGSELNTVEIPPATKGVIIVRVADGSKITTKKVALL